MPIDWSPFVEMVRARQRFLLMTHIKPDCDAIGSEIGMAEVLRQLGKTARVVIVGAMPNRYSFIDPDREVMTFKPSAPEFKDVDASIVLDTGTWNQLGEVGSHLRGLNVAKAVIDHHRTQDDLGGIALVDPSAEATARLVVEAADALGVKITPKAATALFVALATDTGWFRHANTTPATFLLAERLARAGAKPNKLYEALYEQNTLPRLRLIGLALERLQVAGAGRIAYTEIFQRDFADTGAGPGDTEDIVNYPRGVQGVEVALCFTEQPGGSVKVSLRSREAIDIGAVAETFGGGGHRLAAGCSVQGSVPEVRAKLLAALLPLVA